MKGEVTISIKDYEFLKKFKEAAESKKIHTVHYGLYDTGCIDFHTESEAVAKLVNINSKLCQANKTLMDLKEKMGSDHHKEKHRISNMNIFQFIKWRRAQR